MASNAQYYKSIGTGKEIMSPTANNESQNKEPEKVVPENNEPEKVTPENPSQTSKQDEIKEIEAEIARAQADLAAAQAKLREKTPDAPQPPSDTQQSSPPPPQEYYWQQSAQQGAPSQNTGSTAQTAAQGQATPPGSTQNTYQAPAGSAYQAPSQPQQAYTYSGTASKDHIAAGLLAIFLGALGIHKFYLGYNTAGFIMLAVTILGSLLTFGLAAAVMGVIAIIEGILYLVKSQSEFESTYVFNTREWF